MWMLVAWVFYLVIYPDPFVQTPVLVTKPTSLSLHPPIYTLLCDTGATTLQTAILCGQLTPGEALSARLEEGAGTLSLLTEHNSSNDSSFE